MDESLAIERHRKPLLRIVGTMFAMLGLADNTTAEKISRPLYLAILRLLRPAESAVRRLIVVAACTLVLKPPRPRAAAAKPITPRTIKTRKPRPPAFQLFDPLQRVSTRYPMRRHPMPRDAHRPIPRVRVLDVGFDPRIPFLRTAAPPPQPQPEPEAENTISTLRLTRRLIAIKSALDDLPRQALRYALWQSRPAETRRPKRTSALRAGRAPGQRKNPLHKIDEILAECDWLARHPLQPDTS